MYNNIIVIAIVIIIIIYLYDRNTIIRIGSHEYSVASFNNANQAAVVLDKLNSDILLLLTKLKNNYLPMIPKDMSDKQKIIDSWKDTDQSGEAFNKNKNKLGKHKSNNDEE